MLPPLTPWSNVRARKAVTGCPTASTRASPSANGCNMRICLSWVCTEPLCSILTGPASAVALLTGCTNLVRNELSASPDTSFLSIVPTCRTVASDLGLNPLVNFPHVLSIARIPPASSSLAALFSEFFLLCCVNSWFSSAISCARICFFTVIG